MKEGMRKGEGRKRKGGNFDELLWLLSEFISCEELLTWFDWKYECQPIWLCKIAEKKLKVWERRSVRGNVCVYVCLLCKCCQLTRQPCESIFTQLIYYFRQQQQPWQRCGSTGSDFSFIHKKKQHCQLTKVGQQKLMKRRQRCQRLRS